MAMDYALGQKFINSAMVEQKDISSFFKDMCRLLKQKMKSNVASDCFARAMFLFCVNHEAQLTSYLSQHPPSSSTTDSFLGGGGQHANVQIIVDKLADIVNSRSPQDEHNCMTKSICAFVISRIKPNYWENFGMKKRTNSSSSLSRKISVSLKSPSMLDFSPRAHRAYTYTIPEGDKPEREEPEASEDSLKSSITKIFGGSKKSRKETYISRSQSKHEFNSSSLDINENPSSETSYLLELLESFMDTDRPGTDMMQSLTLISRIVVERGKGNEVIEMLEKEEFLSRIENSFGSHFDEFENFALQEISADFMELHFCLTLYFQLATFSEELTRRLIKADSTCFENLCMNLYDQAVLWEANVPMRLQQDKTNPQMMLIMELTSSLITTIVHYALNFLHDPLKIPRRFNGDMNCELKIKVPQITDLDDVTESLTEI